MEKKIISFPCPRCLKNGINLWHEIEVTVDRLPGKFAWRHPMLNVSMTFFLDANWAIRSVEVAPMTAQVENCFSLVCPMKNGVLACKTCPIQVFCNYHQFQAVRDEKNLAQTGPIVESMDKEIINWCNKDKEMTKLRMSPT